MNDCINNEINNNFIFKDSAHAEVVSNSLNKDLWEAASIKSLQLAFSSFEFSTIAP